MIQTRFKKVFSPVVFQVQWIAGGTLLKGQLSKIIEDGAEQTTFNRTLEIRKNE